MNVVAKRFLTETSIIIIIIDERGSEAFAYWKLALLLLLMNVVARRFLIEN